MSGEELVKMQLAVVGEIDAAIVRHEAALRMAQLTADSAALDQLIDEDLLFTGPDGQLGTKAQDLAAHASGMVRFRSHEPLELRARRVTPDVVVCALLARLSVEVAATLHSGTFRYTRVWARQPDGTWRVVGGHVSAVPPDLAV